MLQADQVAVTYRAGRRRTAALPGVSCTLAAGQRLGLTGASGSGKTTLAQVLALLLTPDRGQVRVDGTTVARGGLGAPRRLRRTVQLLWQSPREAVDPRLRLAQAMLEPLAATRELPRGAAARRGAAHRLADQAGLPPELLTRYPHEVSDGQLQRAALARALAVSPRYLVCDEPSAMLDVSTQAALLEVLARHQEQRGIGVLLITHDRLLAEHWCHDIHDMATLSTSG